MKRIIGVRMTTLIAIFAGALALGGEKRYVVDVPPAIAAATAARNGLTLIRILPDGSALTSAPDSIPEQNIIARVSQDPAVKGVEADPDTETAESRNSNSVTQASVQAATSALTNRTVSTFFGSSVREIYSVQAAGSLIHLSECHQKATGAGVVAVIDTGVDPFHPALARSLIPGYDFVNNLPGYANDYVDLNPALWIGLAQSTVAFLDTKNQPLLLNQSTVAFLDQSTVAFLDGAHLPEDFGHGTMVAGLIHLVAPTAKIMPLKAFKADGTAELSNIVRAIYYATDHGANVINMSFSTGAATQELANAIAYATAHKVICVSSAGNQGKEITVYPAAYQKVMGVASTTDTDKRSTFTNYGDSCARTAAPGEALVTTYPGNNYAAVWGTSFSAALVSGAAAVMMQLRPNLSYSQLSDAIEKGPHLNLDCGDARLDLLAIISSLKP